MNKSFYFLFLTLFQLLFANCQNHSKLEIITNLPSSLKENSGLVNFNNQSLWPIKDNGNKDKIYEVNFNREITNQFEVKNTKNGDWEDLPKNPKGNL